MYLLISQIITMFVVYKCKLDSFPSPSLNSSVGRVKDSGLQGPGFDFKPLLFLVRDRMTLEQFYSPLHVLLWGSLSGTLSGTLRIVFQSHLVLCASMRLIVRNNFSFCFLHYFSNFFSKFWYFIIVINPIFLANSKNSLTPWMRSKLPEI